MQGDKAWDLQQALDMLKETDAGSASAVAAEAVSARLKQVCHLLRPVTASRDLGYCSCIAFVVLHYPATLQLFLGFMWGGVMKVCAQTAWHAGRRQLFQSPSKGHRSGLPKRRGAVPPHLC